jgi:glycosyltransferase involved in cell wall biosynthesis
MPWGPRMAERNVLVISHGHPDLLKGGGELAAYSQFRELQRRDGIDAWFLGRTRADDGHGGTPFSVRRDHELLWHSDMPDTFNLSQPNKHIVWSAFRELLGRLEPRVVHFHHYLHVGLELLLEVKRHDPSTRIVMTLHEFWAMCHQGGTMVKARSGALCRRASPADCHACFPQHSPADFFLRELFVKSFFDLVDVFVSPSHFLKSRYVEWGFPADRIQVLENGQEPVTPAPPRPLADGGARNRFAFFGQINPSKGVQVLLDAVDSLPKLVRANVQVEVHGANLELQTEEFQERIRERLKRNRKSVRFMGAYTEADLPKLMAGVDWLVMPSTWWENSPLVIQEAFAHGRPVICSDIGGMAEKVGHGVNGLHFRVGNPLDLAATLQTAMGTPGLWERLRAGVVAPPTVAQTVDRLLQLYD